MFKTLGILILLGVVAVGALLAFNSDSRTAADNVINNKTNAKSVHEFTLKDIDGNDVRLDRYKGKVALLVNTASKCGYTPQYEGLQKIYDKYKDRGFIVLGFPANNFGGQEPGTEAEIKDFCTTKYKTTFPMFAKISVKGEDQHPLYAFLTGKTTNPNFAGDIKWNFGKFLVDGDGRVLARFESKDTPESETVTKAIENALPTTNKAE